MQRAPDQEDEHDVDHPDEKNHQSQPDSEWGQHRVASKDFEAASCPARATVASESLRPPPGADEHRRNGHHGEGRRVDGQGQPAPEGSGQQAADRGGSDEDEGIQ